MAYKGYNMLSRKIILLIVIAVTQGVVVLCLRLREMLVPAVVMRGEAVWLNCSFDLENEKLYSVKWHKDDVEFYRFLPEDIPPAQTYHVEGVHLDLERCDRGNVFMPWTDVRSEGSYRCEVSTEAPTFKTLKEEREMRIYVNPTSRPQIIGRLVSHYSPGEVVNVTCVSAPSRPAAFLKWWINGQEASPDQLLHSQVVEESADDEGLFTSRLTLCFAARPYHFFLGGRLRVQCEAIISQAHTLRSEEIIITNSGTTTATGAYEHLKEGPRIEGDRHSYDVGDVVDLNCTAAKSQPPAELHWYINDKEVRPEYLIPRTPISHPDGKQSTVVGLKFEVKARHFISSPKHQREMKLRCTATLSEVKRMTSEPLEALMSPPHMQHKSDLHVDVDNTGMALSMVNTLNSVPVWSLAVISLFLWNIL